MPWPPLGWVEWSGALVVSPWWHTICMHPANADPQPNPCTNSHHPLSQLPAPSPQHSQSHSLAYSNHPPGGTSVCTSGGCNFACHTGHTPPSPQHSQRPRHSHRRGLVARHKERRNLRQHLRIRPWAPCFWVEAAPQGRLNADVTLRGRWQGLDAPQEGSCLPAPQACRNAVSPIFSSGIARGVCRLLHEFTGAVL